MARVMPQHPEVCQCPHLGCWTQRQAQLPRGDAPALARGCLRPPRCRDTPSRPNRFGSCNLSPEVLSQSLYLIRSFCQENLSTLAPGSLTRLVTLHLTLPGSSTLFCSPRLFPLLPAHVPALRPARSRGSHRSSPLSQGQSHSFVRGTSKRPGVPNTQSKEGNVPRGTADAASG